MQLYKAAAMASSEALAERMGARGSNGDELAQQIAAKLQRAAGPLRETMTPRTGGSRR